MLAIDLSKTVFHLMGLESTGRVVIRKKCSRTQLQAFTANLHVDLIGMESCSGSHFLGRALREQGHEVRLMPAQYVKPYVQTNKSDFLDAGAIAEAVQRPRMRLVPIKSEEQLDLQALHRVRERRVMRRTGVVNQIHSLLLERGLNLPKGRSHVDSLLHRILEDAALQLSYSFRVLLAQLKVELDGGRGPYAYSIEGRCGIEMRGSCAGKRRRQHRVPGSWQKCKPVANGECGEAGRRDLLGDKAENGGSCRSTQSFRGVESRFMQRP